jgi:hypothetical protein
MAAELSTSTTLVPAVIPMTLLDIWYDPGGGDTDFAVFRYPIIAWRIDDDRSGYPIPIAIGCREHDANGRWCQFIECPDGRFQQVGFAGYTFDTLDACCTEVKRAQQREQVRRAA